MRGPRHVGLVVAWLTLVAGLGSCGDRGRFRVVEVRPPATEGPLRRNEAITVLLDREVDPSSVSADSVSVRLEDGTAAAGRFESDGRRVVFIPRPGGSPSYADGGYGAGARVTLTMPGFPSRGLLTAGGGRPLEESVRREFALAALPLGKPSATSFLDPVPGGPRLARPPAAPGHDVEVRAGAALALHFSEPLFPPIQEPVQLRFDDRDRTAVPTSTELVQGERAAVLLVRPTAGFKEGTRYLLELRPEHLTDLVGHPFDGRGLPGEYGVRVVAAGEEGS